LAAFFNAEGSSLVNHGAVAGTEIRVAELEASAQQSLVAAAFAPGPATFPGIRLRIGAGRLLPHPIYYLIKSYRLAIAGKVAGLQ
tara:strand:+ start:826 stop:1080 length:255 start_codon:yes stop_codon:yes gene_type:complete